MPDIIDETQPLDSGLAGSGASDIRATRAAINSIDKKYQDLYKIGKIEILDDYYDPSSEWPFFCLSKSDVILNKTNWADDDEGNGLVSHLRNKKLIYMPGEAAQQSAFGVTKWAISSNVATLTFSNLTPENKILAALAEDQLIHGSYTDWRTITLASAIGSITAGTYAITEIDTVNRTVSFAFTASNNSGSVTATAKFYPHRLPSSVDATGTQARHFKVQGRGFTTVNDSDGKFIGGLRARDQMQRIEGNMGPIGKNDANIFANSTVANNNTTGMIIPDPGIQISYAARSSGSDGGPGYNIKINSSYSPNARTSSTTAGSTHGPGFGVVAYIYGKTYIP